MLLPPSPSNYPFPIYGAGLAEADPEGPQAPQTHAATFVLFLQEGDLKSK